MFVGVSSVQQDPGVDDGPYTVFSRHTCRFLLSLAGMAEEVGGAVHGDLPFEEPDLVSVRLPFLFLSFFFLLNCVNVPCRLESFPL